MKIKDIFKKQQDRNQQTDDLKASQIKDSQKQEKKVIAKSSEVSASPSKQKDYSASLKTKVSAHNISNQVLIKPLVTEKGASQVELGKYLFMVAKSANKIMIARAITETYGVKVSSVNILNYKGKQVRTGRKSGKRKDWKKAVVTLVKGKTIDVYKGV